MEALGEAMMVHQAMDRQVFHGHHLEPMHKTTAGLMRTIVASLRHTLMHSYHHPPPFPPCRRALHRS